jgi:hypothetical protein
VKARLPIIACAALGLAACDRTPSDRMVVIDLLRQTAAAEKRPLGGTFEVVEHRCGDESRPSLSVPVASRVTWSTRFPDRAVLLADAALSGPPGASATFRVGISDDRIYEQLASHTVVADACGPTWMSLEIDLRRYSGWQFSLFYRPRNRTWRIVFGVNAEQGAPERAFWGRPRVESDAAAAKRFYRR